MQLTKTLDEQARFDFVSGLMKYNSTGIGKSMTEYFLDNESKIKPDEPVIESIGAFMNDAPIYKFGAFFELNNHALMFETVLDILEKRRDEVTAWLEDYNRGPCKGQLTLNDEVSTPYYYKNIDIHTQPGSYHAEFAGFLYHWMIGPFLVHRDDQDSSSIPRMRPQVFDPPRCGLITQLVLAWSAADDVAAMTQFLS